MLLLYLFIGIFWEERGREEKYWLNLKIGCADFDWNTRFGGPSVFFLITRNSLSIYLLGRSFFFVNSTPSAVMNSCTIWKRFSSRFALWIPFSLLVFFLNTIFNNFIFYCWKHTYAVFLAFRSCVTIVHVYKNAHL